MLQISYSKSGQTIEIPNIHSFCRLDEDMMNEMYQRILQKGGKAFYYDLVIVSWCYKSDDQDKRERQALLALENLGYIERTKTLDWHLDEEYQIIKPLNNEATE